MKLRFIFSAVLWIFSVLLSIGLQSEANAQTYWQGLNKLPQVTAGQSCNKFGTQGLTAAGVPMYCNGSTYQAISSGASSGTTTWTQKQSFYCDGTFTVPSGVTALYITAIGAGGGATAYGIGFTAGGGGGSSCITGVGGTVFANGGTGGYGGGANAPGQSGSVTNSVIPVSAGQIYNIYVGGGGAAAYPVSSTSGAGAGGYGGGAAGAFANNGGLGGTGCNTTNGASSGGGNGGIRTPSGGSGLGQYAGGSSGGQGGDGNFPGYCGNPRISFNSPYTSLPPSPPGSPGMITQGNSNAGGGPGYVEIRW